MSQHHELITPDLRTTSRVVAEKFGKLHKNVLRDIEKITSETPDEFNRLNFEPVTYLDAKGEARPQYELTRDGFTLLAMGFTGKAAMEWKIRFIEAFNMMEAELSAQMQDAHLPARPGTAQFGDDLSTRDWLALIRETRLLHGVKAGRKMWALSPLPNVAEQPRGLIVSPEDGRSCLSYLLGLDVGGRAVADWLADGQDNAALNRIGLRVQEDGLFVSHATAVFAGSRWAMGQHRVALSALDGVRPVTNPLTLMGDRVRGLTIPFALIAGGFHA